MSRFNWGVPRAAALAVVMLSSQADFAGAQKVLPEGIEDLAIEVGAHAAKQQKHTLAVVPFRELDGRSSVLGTFIAEELVTNLFAVGGLEIVERGMLDMVIGELRLGQAGLIDPETAKQVGRIAGVDAIVTGSITDFQSYVALNCRLIDTQTGRIFAAAQAKIVKDDDLRKIMGVLLAAGSSEMAKPPEATRSGPAGEIERMPPSKPAPQQQVKSILFDLKGCSISGTSVDCMFLMTSKGEDQEVTFSGARLVDEDGSEYRAERVVVGADARRRDARLISGIPLKGEILFQNIDQDIQKAALIEVFFWLPRRQSERVLFRDVSLARD